MNEFYAAYKSSIAWPWEPHPKTAQIMGVTSKSVQYHFVNERKIEYFPVDFFNVKKYRW